MPINDVGDAINEWKAGGSKHIKTRKQAIAVGLSAQRRSKKMVHKSAHAVAAQAFMRGLRS